MTKEELRSSYLNDIEIKVAFLYLGIYVAYRYWESSCPHSFDILKCEVFWTELFRIRFEVANYPEEHLQRTIVCRSMSIPLISNFNHMKKV